MGLRNDFSFILAHLSDLFYQKLKKKVMKKLDVLDTRHLVNLTQRHRHDIILDLSASTYDFRDSRDVYQVVH